MRSSAWPRGWGRGVCTQARLRGPAPSGPTQNSSSAILPGALLRGCGARCGLLLGCWLGAPQEELPPRSTGCALAAGPAHFSKTQRQGGRGLRRTEATHRTWSQPQGLPAPDVQRLPASHPAQGQAAHIYTGGHGLSPSSPGAATQPTRMSLMQAPSPTIPTTLASPSNNCPTREAKQAGVCQTAVSREWEAALPARLLLWRPQPVIPGWTPPSCIRAPPPSAAAPRCLCTVRVQGLVHPGPKAGRGERDEQVPGAGS